MRDWPPITEPELLARLALSDEEFRNLTMEFSMAFGQREFTPAVLEHALSYPFTRPAGSFFLDGGDVELLAGMSPGRRESVVAEFVGERHPILAFGGNGAPSWLEAKFAHFDSGADRQVLVLTGELGDVDVGATATLSPFGNMPATLFASPGTAVRASMIWCTDAQVTQLTWSEVPYMLGRLDDAVFTMDETDLEVENIFAYINRFGAFCVDDDPIALAAVPAVGRTARPFVQRDLLDFVAPRLVGPEATAEDVVRAIWEDFGSISKLAVEEIWPHSRQLQSPWTPYPA